MMRALLNQKDDSFGVRPTVAATESLFNKSLRTRFPNLTHVGEAPPWS
ncbi:hypothetical protein QWZ13_09250 [Reinekea marina]|nr:hypothetical protein [Reinekea marina]MDN3649094.1 hypothetical protein [Reinekea marina]